MIDCKKCAGQNGSKAVYCMHCGAKLLEAPVEQQNAAVRYITAGLLVMGLAPWPYGYYLLLRVVVFCVFGFYFFQFRKKCIRSKREMPVWVWSVGAFALLFNPFFPAFLFRALWAVFDVAGAVVIIKTLKWEKQL